jgi:hypothetical protein
MQACRQFVTMGNTIKDAMRRTLERDPATGKWELTEGGCMRLARELRRNGIQVFRQGSAVGYWMPSVPWVTTEEMWWGWGFNWQRQRFGCAGNPWEWCGDWIRPPGSADPWGGWVGFGSAGVNWGNTQLARCSGGCPQGRIPGKMCSRWGCPWLCRGCQAGWPYDDNLRHIGPVKYPHNNRWDCNRVKWLGVDGAPPDYAQVANY